MAFKGNFIRAPYKRPGILKKGWVRILKCYPSPEEYKEFRRCLAMDELPVARWLNQKIHEYIMECHKHHAEMNEGEK